MTQPTTLATSFDTSLVDVGKSFSSTETNTSTSTGKENVPPTDEFPGSVDTADQPHRQPSPYKEVTTSQLYEQWASTYDTDGNILQFVDDIQMPGLLSEFVSLTSDTQPDLNILDLGCGTGRNTLALIQAPWPKHANRSITFHAWDASTAMLNIARRKCAQQQSEHSVLFDTVDISSLYNIPRYHHGAFDGLISTLVLEHIEITTYFAVAASLLRPGGVAVVTNMHSDMGAQTKAGYKTASGERVKGSSFVYTPRETVEAAEKAGLEVVGGVREAVFEGRMAEGGVLEAGAGIEKSVVAERGRRWVGTRIWYGMVFKKLGG